MNVKEETYKKKIEAGMFSGMWRFTISTSFCGIIDSRFTINGETYATELDITPERANIIRESAINNGYDKVEQ